MVILITVYDIAESVASRLNKIMASRFLRNARDKNT
jgi:hypothetical protein